MEWFFSDYSCCNIAVNFADLQYTRAWMLQLQAPCMGQEGSTEHEHSPHPRELTGHVLPPLELLTFSTGLSREL